MTLRDELAKLIKGDVADDLETRTKYSRDTSIFQKMPAVVVFPKDADDVATIVRYVDEARARGEDISLAARSAGTDMTGGPLTESVALVFSKYMNAIGPVEEHSAEAEPGTYYRDFEAATLAQAGAIMPSYPASRELCAIGGIVSNNSGGELTLRYGKTNRYIERLDVVLSDGTKTRVLPLTMNELLRKEAQQDLEGSIYRNIHRLIDENADEIRRAQPTVTKNSAGYALWNVWRDTHDRGKVFDLNQLLAGSQGTLAIVTKARLALAKRKEHRAMLVIFLSDLGILPEIVKRVLKYQPESFESYDDQTFKLAVKFIPQILKQFGLVQMARLGISFIPEMWMAATDGVPKLVLMAEFAEDTPYLAVEKAEEARAALEGLHLSSRIAKSEIAAKKYWTIRRESFALLRKNLKGLYASPFIDDMVVHPDDYPHFLPELNELLSHYKLIYTIAGHIGDGNFHIIPLMNLSRNLDHRTILELSPKVYEIVAKYKGSITGEHNDGLIRTPYLPTMFSPKMIELFAEVKRIFDPNGILNPGKKVPFPGIGGTIAEIDKFMIKER